MQPGNMNSAETESCNVGFWMSRVMREWDCACSDFASEPVHDLRVALRRCRSIASGFMVFDPHPAWRLMKNAGRKLFQQLGELRDTQVMMEWVERLSNESGETSAALIRHLAGREMQYKESASEALRDFSRKKWESWSRLLCNRAQRIPAGSMAFQHLALERWTEAYALHRQAMRNRSHAAYHRLRIGLKKYRYTIENFLPDRHALWGTELGQLQDLLGEMHDLHVLWQTALAIGAFCGEETRARWRLMISGEINRRLGIYRQAMLGKQSRWHIWRADLPRPGHVGMAALARLHAWSMFRDPNGNHSAHVAKLSLQIHDGLESLGLIPDPPLTNARFLLEAAALAHDAGMHRDGKKHPIHSYRMIRKIPPSPGLDADSLKVIALIARFHQGSLPVPGQKAFSGISDAKVGAILLLCGILRLADAFDRGPKRKIRRLTLMRNAEVLHIHAPGYEEHGASAEKMAAVRHLLETCCALPILISPL